MVLTEEKGQTVISFDQTKPEGKSLKKANTFIKLQLQLEVFM